MTDFRIDSEAGRIGQFWWFNSNIVERPWMGNQWPWGQEVVHPLGHLWLRSQRPHVYGTTR